MNTTNDTTTNDTLFIRHSMLKSLIVRRTSCIAAIKLARSYKDNSWMAKELNYCKNLNHWIRIELGMVFYNDHDRTYNRITELGKLI